MHIKFLGTGGYDDLHCGNSAAILQHEIGNILIDCGASVYEQIRKHDLQDDIDYVLLTHLHGDHMGSLFALRVYITYKLKKQFIILCPDIGFKGLLEQLFTLWWSDAWKESIIIRMLGEVPGITAINTYGKHMKGIQTYAYIFENEHEIMYYSGDLNDISVTTEALCQFDKKKKISVFHEVTWQEAGKSVHCWYKELQDVLVGYDAYLYHCDHLEKPSDCILSCVAEQPHLLFS